MSNPLTEEEQKITWTQWYGQDRKLPGSHEKLEDKCGSKLRSKELKDLGLERYCTKSAGYGTSHKGTGTCKLHLGSVKNMVIKAARTELAIDVRKLSEQLGEAPSILPPEVEILRMAARMKQFMLIMEDKVDELNGQFTSFDAKGTEQLRSVLELWERSTERFAKILDALIKNNLALRVIQLEEAQARMVGELILKVLLSQELGLSEAKVAVARQLFATQMSAAGSSLSPSWSAEFLDDDTIVDAEIIG